MVNSARVLLGGLVLGGALVLSASAAPVASRALNDDERRMIEDAIRSQLRDPFSAIIELVNFNGNPTLCGRVNAKNEYGGYAGFRVFFIDLTVNTAGTIIGAKPPFLGGSPLSAEEAVWQGCQRKAREPYVPSAR